jgi:uncharacterized membrane protein
MLGPRSRLPAALALAGSLFGLVFASYSTMDYAAHLDRRLHDIHCSIIPGMPVTAEAEACRAAMYSPYSSLLKQQYWGGIPISLFALGAFTFFAGFALYLLLAGPRAPRLSVRFFAWIGLTPLLVSIMMFTISVVDLGEICKVCAGIYISSLVLAIGGLLGLRTLRPEAGAAPAQAPATAVTATSPRPPLSFAFALIWLVTLGLVTLLPAVVYAATMPDERPYLTRCGELKTTTEVHHALIHMKTSQSVQPTILFEDPLCPTCKAFDERLVAEGIFDRLDVELALFPLDTECNWMLDSSLHPGACMVSRAVICGGNNARQVLEWAFANQDELKSAGKAGSAQLQAVIQKRWGSNLVKCMDDRETKVRLNEELHFASDNNVPVSTPQMYLGKRRVCDEDTDLGLVYTLKQLAPEVVP